MEHPFPGRNTQQASKPVLISALAEVVILYQICLMYIQPAHRLTQNTIQHYPQISNKGRLPLGPIQVCQIERQKLYYKCTNFFTALQRRKRLMHQIFNICWQMVSCWFILLMPYLPLLDICGITQIWVSLRWSIYILLFGWLPTTLRLPGEKHGPDSIKNVCLVIYCFPLSSSCLEMLSVQGLQFSLKFISLSIQLFTILIFVKAKIKFSYLY